MTDCFKYSIIILAGLFGFVLFGVIGAVIAIIIAHLIVRSMPVKSKRGKKMRLSEQEMIKCTQCMMILIVLIIILALINVALGYY